MAEQVTDIYSMNVTKALKMFEYFSNNLKLLETPYRAQCQEM